MPGTSPEAEHEHDDFDTSTEGVDIVAAYDTNLFGGRTGLSLAFNHNETEVERFNPETLNDTRIRQLQEGLPETRWSGTGGAILGRLARACQADLLRWLVRQRGRCQLRRGISRRSGSGVYLQRCTEHHAGRPGFWYGRISYRFD